MQLPAPAYAEMVEQILRDLYDIEITPGTIDPESAARIVAAIDGRGTHPGITHRLKDATREAAKAWHERIQVGSLTIAGVGRVEKIQNLKNTWQHGAVAHALAAREAAHLADEPEVWYDTDTGSMHPLAIIAAGIAERVADTIIDHAAVDYWRQRNLANSGIDPKAYYSTEETSRTIKVKE